MAGDRAAFGSRPAQPHTFGFSRSDLRLARPPQGRRLMKRTKRAPISRRDGAGHLNPEYEAHLLALGRASRDDESAAFVDDVMADSDPYAMELALEYVESVT